MNRRTKTAQESTVEEHNESFEWINRKQHVLYFFAYVMSYSADCAIFLENIEEMASNETVHHKNLQFITLTIVVGAPILFLQNSIGQYTRNSCLILGGMLPLFYGIGYCMLFLSCCELISQMYYTTKLVCYAIVAVFNTFPAWMKCYKVLYADYPNCLSREDIDDCATRNEPCFKPHTRILSAQIFKEGVVFSRLKMNRKEAIGSNSLLMSDTFFIMVFCISNSIVVLVLLIIATSRSIKAFYMPLKALTVICVGLFVSIGITVAIQPGIGRGFHNLQRDFTLPRIFNLDTWIHALVLMVKSLRLAEGGHILFGSYFPVERPDFWRSLILILVYLGIIGMSSTYYHIFLGLLLQKLSVGEDDILKQTEENLVFVLFPTVLGILPSCYVLSLAFFFGLVLLNVFSMVVKVMVIEQGITKYFRLPQYSVYVRYTICFGVTAVAGCMEKDEIVIQFYNLQKFYGLCTVLILAVQQIMVIVYGIQNFFDDIEYIMKVRLKSILKFTWILTPIFCLFAGAHLLAVMEFKQNTTLKIIYGTIVVTPLFIAFVVQFFHSAKRKNLVGLLRPSEQYGPPRVEDRILRVLYNKRLMVKYNRYHEICNHECLLNSPAVKIAIEEELQMIKNFEDQLHFKSNKAWEEKINSHFTRHQKYLLKYIEKYENTSGKLQGTFILSQYQEK